MRWKSASSIGGAMFLDLRVGNLIEPLTGRRWEGTSILRRTSGGIAYLQNQGLSDSDPVFLHYGNTPEFFIDLMAVWSLGGCAVPIDPRLTRFEVETLARAAAPRYSLWLGRPDEPIAGGLSGMGTRILDMSNVPDAGPAVPANFFPGNSPSLDKPALILFTSGTTGDPKGVVHTHRSLRARWMSLRQSLGIGKFRRTLCLLPTHFGHGLICNCLFPWLSGQDLYILPPFKPDVILRLGSLLDENGITFMSSVPAVWRLALKTAKPPQAGTLERVFCGSAPLSAFLWKEVQKWTGAGEVLNSYGITETGSWVAGTTVPDYTPEDGLIGEPWGAIIKILKQGNTENPPAMAQECPPGEAGYVWINTPALMKGYLGRDDLTGKVVSQGWFFTGDIGIVDERGWLYLRGREREEINKGGMKVYPADIDSVAERWEQTVDVCTFGFEDPLLGENVGMAFVLKAAGDESLRAFVNWLRQHLGTHQMPQRWYLLDEIPRTSRGKVNRSDVARICGLLDPVDIRRLFR
jgi:acyl-CoA synthetase (AMP-forming)/AMP-acid ligase II